MTGTVITREVYEGQYVKEGDRLFELADFSKMWFRFDAYERDLAWIKPGQQVDVTTPAVPGKVFAATITFIDPNLDDKTRSAKVRVELNNPLVERGGKLQRELYHRLYAEGLVKIEVPETLCVPRSAVLSPAGQPVVYVDKGGGIYEQRKLKLGRAGDDLWEVLDGLQAGERVVTAGNLLIDAQAQLNSGTVTGHQHGGMTGAVTSASAPQLNPAAALNESQQSAAKDFIVLVDALNGALAKSSVAEFNQHAAKSHVVIPALAKALADAPAWQPLVQQIEQAGHLGAVTDIKAARKAFEPFSVAAVAFARNLRAQGAAFAALKIYECPMTKMAFPGAPKKSQWLQMQGPLRNPFLAPDMIDCGTEIK
jgi:Cu(I)/Ag(I) efflux system membrane fusion protein